MPPDETIVWPYELVVSPEEAGKRLDALVTSELGEFSRAQVQRAIAAGHVLVDGEREKPSLKLEAGQRVVISTVDTPRPGPQPEELPLDLLYEDDWLVAVNKPAGMIVHPAKGHWHGTLASALAYHFEQLSGTGGPTRPGIVHRLDRDTSGVIIVAKTDQAHDALAAQFKARTVQKEYHALVRGIADRDADVIDRPIGVHPHMRERMAIREGHSTSRPALTTLEVIERFPKFTYLKAFPKTGRTHQIRVHLASIALPVLCDKHYGGSASVTRGDLLPLATRTRGADLPGDQSQATVVLSRQALHARRITLDHPHTEQRTTFEAPLATDIQAALDCLRGTN